ncbi:hypothetical protein [Burkholderia phage BCSR5]|nr:hypothetical protein [Burkholderia phage BCSR5]
MDPLFYYPVTLHRDMQASDVLASTTIRLPVQQNITDLVMTLVDGEGPKADQAMYLWDSFKWQMVLPYIDVCESVVRGDLIHIYYALSQDVSSLPEGSLVYKNGIPYEGTVLTASSNAVWTVRQPAALASGTVQSVNHKLPDAKGDVEIGIPDIPGLEQALIDAGKVKTVNMQQPDANGNVTTAVDSTDATLGVSLVLDTGVTSGKATIKKLVPGTGIQLTQSADSKSVTIASTGALTSLMSVGTGNSLVKDDGSTSHVPQIRSLAQGPGITIVLNADQSTLTTSWDPYAAKTNQLGAVKVPNGGGLAIAVDGALTSAPPTATTIGSVKAGTGVTIDPDGTLNVTALGGVTSVDGQKGDVIVKAVDTSTLSGNSLVSDSGATTGIIKVKRLVAGTGVTLSDDPNGNLKIDTAATGGGVMSLTGGTGGAKLTGDIRLIAGPAISISSLGQDIQISGTGVEEAPNDTNTYVRGQMKWIVAPPLDKAITSVDAATGTGSVIPLVMPNPPANHAVIKSLVAGNNVTITDNNAGILTIAASLPNGTVATVQGVPPDNTGNVTLTPQVLNALDKRGDAMAGQLDMAAHVLTGLVDPVNPTDAVNLRSISSIVIDNGTF